MTARAIFFDEDDARAAVARLSADGYDAHVVREPLAGEDDDDDHPWALVSDAPDIVLELVVEDYDGWLDVEEPPPPVHPPLELPITPKRIKRPDLD